MRTGRGLGTAIYDPNLTSDQRVLIGGFDALNIGLMVVPSLAAESSILSRSLAKLSATKYGGMNVMPKFASNLGGRFASTKLGSVLTKQRTMPFASFLNKDIFAKNSGYKTTPMRRRFLTESEAGNKIWPGKQVKYLNETELSGTQIYFKNGKVYCKNGQAFISTGESSLGKNTSIFVMDKDGNIFMSNLAERGKFHHSSFFRGEELSAAGEIRIENGVIKEFNNNSEHYYPSEIHHN